MLKPSLVFVLSVVFSAAAFAQTATVLGTVTDPSGSVIPNATITITNTATGVKRSSRLIPAAATQRRNCPSGRMR